MFRRNPATKLNTSESQKAWYEIEWFPGLSNKVTFTHNEFVPIGDLDISYFADDSRTVIKNNFTTTSVSFFTRFAYREKFVAGKVDRISLGSDYPTIQVNYTKGFKGFYEGDFNFDKLSIRIDDRLKTRTFWLYVLVLSAGRTWGKSPTLCWKFIPATRLIFMIMLHLT
ncbi:MAG: hypothetical protein IPP46_19305 [Bacteroidetes bacterium]|nr:hypothetical protein [Bacteroidota bacterium]